MAVLFEIQTGESVMKKVFTASAFGALIGCLVAFRVNYWFWWLGLIAGFLTGYMTFEWRTVLKVVSHAFKSCSDPDNIVFFRSLFWTLLKFTAACSWLGVAGGLYVLLLRSHVSEGWQGLILGIVIGCPSGIFLGEIKAKENAEMEFFGARWKSGGGSTYKELMREFRVQWIEKDKRSCLLYLPPVALSYVLWKSVTLLWNQRKLAWRFFLLIHSEQRLICGFDAALGTLIAYMVQHSLLGILVGTLSGGLIGLINHSLVTERWLKAKGYLPLKS